MMKKKCDKNKLFVALRAAAVISSFFWALILPSCLFADGLAPIDETVGRLQKVYDETRDFQAGFVQETTVKSIRKTDVEEGVVYFKNPRQMLWDYHKPKAKKLIINERNAWLYLPQDKAVYTRQSALLFRSEALIKFLSGLGSLGDDFTIRYAEPDAIDKNGNYLLRLYPREKGASYQFLQMTLDKNDFHILQVSFDDVMDNATVLKFTGIKINRGLSSKMFQFEVPPGVSVFEMP
jgi:outer membrane lipoprotein carrier protein